MIRLRAGFMVLAGAAALAGGGGAQEPQPGAGLTIEQAVARALQHYPSIRVSEEQRNAAAAGIRMARTAYLPRVDAVAQANRATRNNVFGLVLPQSVLPAISGPAAGSNNLGTVWGSAAGALVSWEPFDFGSRRAGVEAAAAARALSEASLRRTRFEVAVTTADAFLTLLAAQETIRAAQSGVERAGTTARIVAAQVKAELRPGADQSRAEAELAAARTQFIQAQQAADVARATLAQFTGLDPGSVQPSESVLRRPPAGVEPGTLDAARIPAAAEQQAVTEYAQAQLRVIERSLFPKFYLQGSAYARGTGAELDGRRLGGLNGLAPNIQNYALGLTVAFPLLDLPAIHAREAAQSAAIRSQIARSEQLAADLRAQWNRAVAILNGARRIAQMTPAQVAAARDALRQGAARYEAGLGNIAEVADAQRLLTQAEIDDALARLNVWRGLLAVAAAAGDIQPFVAEAGR